MEFDLEMENRGYVFDKVFPVLDVQSQSGPFGKITIESLLKAANTSRAPGANYSRGEWDFTTDSYICEEHGYEEPVDDRESKMYRSYFDAELVATMRAYGQVLRAAEQRVADILYNATMFSSYTTGITNEWDDFSNAIPITDVEAAVQSIYDASGLWANTLIVNKKQFRNLRQCDQVLDRIAASGAGDGIKASDVTIAMLSAVFDLNVVVAGMSKDSAKEGQAASPAQIWSDEYAMVCKVATSQDLREPCIGRTFHWAEDGSMIGGMVESYREEQTRSDIIRVRHDTDEKLLYAAAGHLLSNVTTI